MRQEGHILYSMVIAEKQQWVVQHEIESIHRYRRHHRKAHEKLTFPGPASERTATLAAPVIPHDCGDTLKPGRQLPPLLLLAKVLRRGRPHTHLRKL